MAYPQFNDFELQTDNYIIKEIVYRNTPGRSLESEQIARRPGVKLLANEFGSRTVTMSGFIQGSGASDLQDKIDDLHTNVTRKNEGALYITSDRSATAIVVSVAIADPHYSQDFVPFDIEFLLADPFFYKSQHLANWTVVSGTGSTTKTVTISGSVFAVPTLKYYSPDGSGQTTTSGIGVEYVSSGQTITWSGTGVTPQLAYGDDVTFDFNHHRILEATDEIDPEGVFFRWEPGSTSFTVTFSGTALGGELELAYQPRYL